MATNQTEKADNKGREAGDKGETASTLKLGGVDVLAAKRREVKSSLQSPTQREKDSITKTLAGGSELFHMLITTLGDDPDTRKDIGNLAALLYREGVTGKMLLELSEADFAKDEYKFEKTGKLTRLPNTLVKELLSILHPASQGANSQQQQLQQTASTSAGPDELQLLTTIDVIQQLLDQLRSEKEEAKRMSQQARVERLTMELKQLHAMLERKTGGSKLSFTDDDVFALCLAEAHTFFGPEAKDDALARKVTLMMEQREGMRTQRALEKEKEKLSNEDPLVAVRRELVAQIHSLNVRLRAARSLPAASDRKDNDLAPLMKAIKEAEEQLEQLKKDDRGGMTIQVDSAWHTAVSVAFFNAEVATVMPADPDLETMRRTVAKQLNVADATSVKLYWYNVPGLLGTRSKIAEPTDWKLFLAERSRRPDLVLYAHESKPVPVVAPSDSKQRTSPDPKIRPKLFVDTAAANAASRKHLSPTSGSPRTPTDPGQVKAVKKRDGQQCIVCDTKLDLNCDHIVHRNMQDGVPLPSDFGSENDTCNGITTCNNHHKQMDVSKVARLEVKRDASSKPIADKLGNFTYYWWVHPSCKDTEAIRFKDKLVRVPPADQMRHWIPVSYIDWLARWQEKKLKDAEEKKSPRKCKGMVNLGKTDERKCNNKAHAGSDYCKRHASQAPKRKADKAAEADEDEDDECDEGDEEDDGGDE